MMTGLDRDLLFDLLPQFVRGADAVEPSQPLRTLYRVLQDAYDRVERDVVELYDDWFIETCAERVVPLIAASVGAESAGPPLWSHRAEVANSLGWRSRRGTLATLAQAAASATGWPAVAADLGADVATSAVIGPAPGPPAVVRIPRTGAVDPRAPRCVGVSPVPPARGRSGGAAYRVPGAVSILLHTTSVFVVEDAAPGRREGHFSFDAAGRGGPIYCAPDVFAPAIAEPAPGELPQPLTRPLLRDLLATLRPKLPFAIRLRTPDGWAAVPPERIRVARLDSTRRPRPVAGEVLLDPEQGLFAIGGAMPAIDDLRVDYAFGFGGPVGAAARSGRAWTPPSPAARRVVVADIRAVRSAGRSDGPGLVVASLADAVAAWDGASDLDIRIADGGRHPALPTIPRLGAGVVLTISAADGAHPLIEGLLTLEGHEGSRLVLHGLELPNGVRLEGPDLALHGATVGLAIPAALRIDCGWRSGRVRIADSIVGPVRCEAARLTAERSIFDGRHAIGGAPEAAIRGLGGAFAGSVELDRCTVLGDLHLARAATLTDCAVDGMLHEPDGSRRLRAAFVTTRLGDPSYLRPDTEDRDDARRGAFGDADRAGRLHALDAAIARHLPQGLSCAVVLRS